MESDVFAIERGTKQDDLKIWREKRMGISLGDHQPNLLSNLRFANDVL